MWYLLGFLDAYKEGDVIETFELDKIRPTLLIFHEFGASLLESMSLSSVKSVPI